MYEEYFTDVPYAMLACFKGMLIKIRKGEDTRIYCQEKKTVGLSYLVGSMITSAMMLASEIPQYRLIYQVYNLDINLIDNEEQSKAKSYTCLFISMSLLKSAKYLFQYSSLIYETYVKMDNG
jgi:hypothetical protein